MVSLLKRKVELTGSGGQRSKLAFVLMLSCKVNWPGTVEVVSKCLQSHSFFLFPPSYKYHETLLLSRDRIQ